ncbi:NUDIX domain-containing protein [Nocardia xishanensis]
MRHSRRPSPAYRPAHPGRPRPRRGRPRPGGGRRRRSLAPHNTGYADGQRNLPSGKLEDGEDVVDAVIRETHEEIGIQLDRDEVRLCFLDPLQGARRTQPHPFQHSIFRPAATPLHRRAFRGLPALAVGVVAVRERRLLPNRHRAVATLPDRNRHKPLAVAWLGVPVADDVGSEWHTVCC